MLRRRRAEYFQCGEELPENLFFEKSGRRIDYSRFAKAWKHAQSVSDLFSGASARKCNSIGQITA